MTLSRLVTAAACALLSLPALAQTTVKDALRGPAAGVIEIHEMKMDGSTMKMRAVPTLDLPAGKAVELKPGGFHVMMMDLKLPLAAGQSVDLTLVVEGRDGKKETIAVKAPVKAPGSAPAGDMAGHKH